MQTTEIDLVGLDRLLEVYSELQDGLDVWHEKFPQYIAEIQIVLGKKTHKLIMYVSARN